jgi:hypothetical protein
MSATESVFKQSLDEVVDRIKGLNISGIARDQIALRKHPWDNRVIHRGITVSPDTEREYLPLVSTNQRDSVGYPCVVTYVRGTDKGWASNLDTITEFRQKVRREFNNRKLTSVVSTDVNHLVCTVLHGKVDIPEKYVDNHDVSQLIVMCWFIEPRTN